MDYDFKNLEKSKWKLYGAWDVLRHLPKFRFDIRDYDIEDLDPETENENKNDAIVGMMVLGSNQTTTTTSTTSTNKESVSSTKSFSGFGRDKSKKLAEQEHNKQKFEVFNKNIKIGKSIVDKLSSLENILQKKTKVNIWKTVAAATTDPIKKEELLKKILDLMDSF